MLEVEIHPELRFLLHPRRRSGPVQVGVDEGMTVGHVVESLGVPLTEVGDLLLDAALVPRSHRARDGDRLEVRPLTRPQPAPTDPPRFLLDVHLGALARRLWLLGVDAAYSNDAGDDELVETADTDHRVLLTQDRGLLRRRALPSGAYVRGSRADEQLDDVLDRFAPDLAPWTRCGACGGWLEPVEAASVAHLLEPGTRRTHTEFSRCSRCARPYWRGAHSRRIEEIVRRGQEVVARRRAGEEGVTPRTRAARPPRPGSRPSG